MVMRRSAQSSARHWDLPSTLLRPLRSSSMECSQKYRCFRAHFEKQESSDFFSFPLQLIRLKINQKIIWFCLGRLIWGTEGIHCPIFYIFALRYNSSVSIFQEKMRQENDTSAGGPAIFSLRALTPQSKLYLTHHYEPIEYPFSDKKLSTLPKYRSNSIDSYLPCFTTEMEMALATRSQKATEFPMPFQGQQNKKQTIYEPKPKHKYCHNCQENFEDYLQHISHPVHKKRLYDKNGLFDLEDLREVFSRRQENENMKEKDSKHSSKVSFNMQKNEEMYSDSDYPSVKPLKKIPQKDTSSCTQIYRLSKNLSCINIQSKEISTSQAQECVDDEDVNSSVGSKRRIVIEDDEMTTIRLRNCSGNLEEGIPERVRKGSDCSRMEVVPHTRVPRKFSIFHDL